MMIATSLPAMRGEGVSATVVGEEFEELHEHIVAVGAVERQGELGGEQAIFFADVVAAAFDGEREVTFTGGELGECGGELDTAAVAGSGDVFGEDLHHQRSEHVHSKKTEVVAGAQTGNDETLLGSGGRGFFEDVLDFIQVRALRDALAADGAVIRQHAFASGLNGGDGGGFGRGGFDELLGAALIRVADVEVIADEMEKRRGADELAGTVQRVAVTERRGLLNELQPPRERAGCRAERIRRAGADDQADFFRAGTDGFFEDDLERGFRFSIAIHQSLEWERVRFFAGSGDNGFFDVHDCYAS